MKQVNIYIGTEFAHDGKPLNLNAAVYVKRLCEAVTDITGGCSSSPVRGHYRHASGLSVTEASIHVMTVAANLDQIMRVRALVGHLRDKLEQESILMTVQDVEAVFV